MESDCAKTLFLEILLRAKEKYSFLLFNFVILGNHFHILIKPLAQDSLASIMRYIMGVYAMAYNRVYRNCGRLWGGRYFSRPIDSYAEFLQVFHYIDANAVKAGLVDLPEHWPFSGIYHHIQGKHAIIDPLPIWLLLNTGKHEVRKLGTVPKTS